MQQQHGSQSHYGGGGGLVSSAEAAPAAAPPSMAAEADQTHVVEEASPISSRPPAGAISAVNLDELMTLSGAAADVAADQGGGSGGGGGGGGGNRWPRQETLALLRIRSEMDVAFRDATLKGPLWEDVSRKLAELGYKRNAKKCKEKFENVHKYYKRTKEGRAGRQDGKSYKFFSELEALHGTATPNVSASPPVHVTTAAATNNPASIGFGSISNPMPISSFRMTPTTTTTIPVIPSQVAGTIPIMPSTTAAPMDINFSSNSSSSSHGDEDDYEDDDDVAGEPSSTSRKRKRGTSSSRDSGGGTRRMMEFFEILMKQVMQKQETMQQRFLEVIEKREQDRNIREEAWKRQEMARLTREHDLMTQERAISASRDAAIIAFLQKITGQTIQLPPPLNVHNAPPPPVPPSVSVHVTPVSAPPPPQQSVQVHQHQQQTPIAQISRHHQIQPSITPNPNPNPNPTEVVMAVPEQQMAPPQENVAGSGGGFEATTSSSRWPKAEVLALIKLRSGLETRYQEAGPKGPLWEEISAGMQRMGYKRNPKRCKEKWENINKYFKKVKESNKARPEDAKTCPYFHELDALYRKRILGGGSSGGGGSSSSLGNQSSQQQPPEQPKLDSATQGTVAASVPAPQTQGTVAATTDQSLNKSGDQSTNPQKNLFGDGPEEAAKKPEDIVKELMGQQQHRHHQQVLNHQGPQQLLVEDYDRVEEADSDINLDQEEDEEDDEDEEDEEMDDESRKMDYKIEFQKQQNTGPSTNGGGNGATSFLAMVQ